MTSTPVLIFIRPCNCCCCHYCHLDSLWVSSAYNDPSSLSPIRPITNYLNCHYYYYWLLTSMVPASYAQGSTIANLCNSLHGPRLLRLSSWRSTGLAWSDLQPTELDYSIVAWLWAIEARIHVWESTAQIVANVN